MIPPRSSASIGGGFPGKSLRMSRAPTSLLLCDIRLSMVVGEITVTASAAKKLDR